MDARGHSVGFAHSGNVTLNGLIHNEQIFSLHTTKFKIYKTIILPVVLYGCGASLSP
jgi:hypothetical protein